MMALPAASAALSQQVHVVRGMGVEHAGILLLAVKSLLHGQQMSAAYADQADQGCWANSRRLQELCVPLTSHHDNV